MKTMNQFDAKNLPSKQQLKQSTIKAFVVAMTLLITIILPAEYAIDPTGVGRLLGLQRMGEIKVQLAEESQAKVVNVRQNSKSQATELSAESVVEVVSNISQVPTEKPAEDMDLKTEVITKKIQADASAEIKVVMNKGQKVTYSWSVDTGHLNYDGHGENKSNNFVSYSKGKKETSKSGTMTAPFDGEHGWFWRNRSGQSLTLTLEVSGDFKQLKEY